MYLEVNTFHEQRIKDIKSAQQRFLQEQIKFYQKVRGKAYNLSLVDLEFDIKFRRLSDGRTWGNCEDMSEQARE